MSVAVRHHEGKDVKLNDATVLCIGVRRGLGNTFEWLTFLLV